MAWWFSSVFTEDPGLTHGLVPKDPKLFSDSAGTTHTGFMYIHAVKTHICIE